VNGLKIVAARDREKRCGDAQRVTGKLAMAFRTLDIIRKKGLDSMP